MSARGGYSDEELALVRRAIETTIAAGSAHYRANRLVNIDGGALRRRIREDLRAAPRGSLRSRMLLRAGAMFVNTVITAILATAQLAARPWQWTNGGTRGAVDFARHTVSVRNGETRVLQTDERTFLADQRDGWTEVEHARLTYEPFALFAFIRSATTVTVLGGLRTRMRRWQHLLALCDAAQSPVSGARPTGQSNPALIRVELWIDRRGRIRRVQVGDSAETSATPTERVQFYRFGAAVDVPPLAAAAGGNRPSQNGDAHVDRAH